jgi:hypothetical protein
MDALQVQQMGKQKAGGAGADDGNLGTHCRLLKKYLLTTMLVARGLE